MAPEVLLGRPYNEKADIFSLAVIMFEIFSKCTTGGILRAAGLPFSSSQEYAIKASETTLHASRQFANRGTRNIANSQLQEGSPVLLAKTVLLQVANCYRQPLPEHWPKELSRLITRCWSQMSDVRPSASEVRCFSGALQMFHNGSRHAMRYCILHTLVHCQQIFTLDCNLHS